MTDEELVKRLRNAKATQDFRNTLEDEAADRIEALIVEKKYLLERVMEQDDHVEQLQQALKDQSSVSDRLAEANEKLTAERDEHWKSFVHWRKEADALTEQLEAARADAKEAEAYADELAGDQVDLCRQLIAAEAKLAKAVEALQAFKAFDDMPTKYKRPDVFEVSVRRKLLSTLAEIEGEKG